MHIDQCQHTFEHLAQKVLPSYMKELCSRLNAPKPASLFCLPGSGPITVAREFGLEKDFSGCYVLMDKEQSIYVGISRGVLSRLRQHLTGKTHFDASLAYAMAQKRLPTHGQRSTVMEKPEFKQAFVEAQSYLRSLGVAFIEIANPLELYVFEAYAAMSLGTHAWNTFRTH